MEIKIVAEVFSSRVLFYYSRSDDPKFITLINHSLDKSRFNTMDEDRLIGMIGLNPTTGRPLNLGVRSLYENDSIILCKVEILTKPWLYTCMCLNRLH